ncbi:MAG TPA: patatin-like phospholipase family protein [Jatrophihabitans sp.]|jgi:hypothetical protein|uniref:patatin-like phospholipase family protein n=1 Tax=Jatrophihabitans sp. TaxID=1932789 RepID=UPI002F06DF02
MADAPEVVVASGHMVDAADRSTPRFPAGEVERVTREVAATLRGWNVGPSTTVVCGGARGADIIVAEQARELGARVRLCLAAPAEQFEQTSVALPGTDWVARFRALSAIADVEVVPPASDPADDVYSRTNQRLIEITRSYGGHPHAVIVWNGAEGDGPGGTRNFVRQLAGGGRTGPVHVIDPTPRAYESRQSAPGPKKLLALDGGGIRGVLSLEILRSMEAQLRQRRGSPDLVLADYFDYVGGTSTGAVIAAALAMGRSVAEVQDRYISLASTVFRKRFLPFRLRSFYPDDQLRSELEDFFGPGRTLGAPEFRSLVLLVLHNTVTDSAWPLSNCTQAKYNRADRCLQSPSDRNLDLSLTELLRGSTAAPVYFAPQTIRVGSHEFVFQDGGLTPFNNPALLMYVMATLPEYGLNWRAGPEDLLVVSVGTGSAASVHPGLRPGKVWLGFNAKNFPSVFMRGASVGQDLLARAFGSTRAGEEIDREFGARLNPAPAPGGSRFSYVRYDANLSKETLQEYGITSSRAQKTIRKLDAVGEMAQLRAIGEKVGRTVDVADHFRGFL